MKLCSYSHNSVDSYGAITERGIVDLSSRIGDRYPTLVTLIKNDALALARETVADATPDFRFTDVNFLPLTSEPVNFICHGMNYRDHLEEMGRTADPYPRGFFKSRQALVGHLQTLAMPTLSTQYDYEGEYCIVIGKLCHGVAKSDAMNYVAGYTILMDGSVRDYQKRTTFQGKNFWRSGALGPCMVTRDAAPAWSDTRLETRLNGEVMQSANLTDLIHDVPSLVSYFSGIVELHPGDIISTGTTGGVGHGRTPPIYLKRGDTVEVEITGIGTLKNTVE
jgi:2-keto-4-pentenoate hydratase/2-oxohepta-3-ene-1,7-dioic acid hydratase in catechol pathway